MRTIVLGHAIPMLAVSLATCAFAADAHGDPAPRLTVAWSAPAECTTDSDVRARVDRILGAHATPREDVDARVNVAKDGEAFRAQIQLFSAGQTSTRQVEDTSCDALADAVALIVALTVNPEAVTEKKKVEQPKPPPPSPATPEKKSNEPASTSESRRPIYAGAGLLLDTATLASLAVGAEIALGYNPHHVALELAGTWLSTQDAHLAPGSLQGASEFSLGGGARGCWEIFDAAFDIGPCGGAEVDGIFANGFNASTSGETSVALLRALVGARAKLRFSRFALRLDAEAAIPFTRPSFVIDNAGTVQHVSPATLRTTFGAEAHF